MSKTLDNLAKRHPDRVAGYYRDEDGWWLDLARPWSLDGCTTIHEDSVRDVVRQFRAAAPDESAWT